MTIILIVIPGLRCTSPEDDELGGIHGDLRPPTSDPLESAIPPDRTKNPSVPSIRALIPPPPVLALPSLLKKIYPYEKSYRIKIAKIVF